MGWLRSFLRYTRIETDQHLSLTTVAFLVGCACLIAGKSVDLTALGAFTVAVAAHRHREAAKV